MFGLILTAAVTLLHLYVFWRVSSIVPEYNRITKQHIAIFGVTMWGLFVVGWFYGHDSQGLLTGRFEQLTMNWMGGLFLCMVSLLAVELLTGYGYFFKKKLPMLRGSALLLGLTFAVVAMVQGTKPPLVSSYEVVLEELPPQLNGTVIVAVSDIHLGSMVDASWLEARIDQILAEKPDLIFLLGDIYEGRGASPELNRAMAQLHAPMGVWAVMGNHEFHRGGEESNVKAFADNGIALLRNSWTEVKEGLVLAGVDDLTRARRNGHNNQPLQQALDGRPQGATILLSHSPLCTETASGAGVSLMLSGHTHAGQIWPFNYLVQQRYPMLDGRYQVGNMTLIVSRGAGTWGPRMRLWAPGEIVSVKLLRPEANE